MGKWFNYLTAMSLVQWKTTPVMLLGNVTRECISAGLEAVWIGEVPTCQRKMLKKNVLWIHTH